VPSPKLAVYPGSFDPVTNGHLDIIKRALVVFDELHVAIAENSNKTPLFSLEERKGFLQESLEEFGGRVKVVSFSGLLVNYVREVGSHCIVRGLRVVTDYDYEAMMAQMNRKLADDIETTFLVASEQTAFINSSIVREVSSLGGDISDLVPGLVAEALKSRFSASKV